MAHEFGNFDANLSAAAGNDPELHAELLACFSDSLNAQIDLLKRSRCDGNWIVASQRLNSLGASFHSEELVQLAAEALDSAPGDPVILRKLSTLSEGFKPGN